MGSVHVTGNIHLTGGDLEPAPLPVANEALLQIESYLP
jgi:hypothetical protein